MSTCDPTEKVHYIIHFTVWQLTRSMTLALDVPKIGTILWTSDNLERLWANIFPRIHKMIGRKIQSILVFDQSAGHQSPSDTSLSLRKQHILCLRWGRDIRANFVLASQYQTWLWMAVYYFNPLSNFHFGCFNQPALQIIPHQKLKILFIIRLQIKKLLSVAISPISTFPWRQQAYNKAPHPVGPASTSIFLYYHRISLINHFCCKKPVTNSTNQHWGPRNQVLIISLVKKPF